MNKTELSKKILISTCVLETLVMSDKLIDPFNLPKFYVLLFGATILSVLMVFYFNTFNLKKYRSLIFILIGFVTAQFLTMFINDQNFYRALAGTWGRNNGIISYLSLSIILFSGALLLDSNDEIRVSKVLSILGFVEAVYGLMQWQDADFFKWNYNGNKVFLSLGNEDFASVFLVISILATIFYASKVNSDLIKIASVGNALLQLIVLLKINTAQSKLALLASVMIYVLFHLQRFLRKSQFVRYSIVGSTIAFVFLSVIGFFGHGPFAFINHNLGSLQSRYMHWVAGWRMFYAHPIYGVGIDSYGDYQPQYRILDSNGVPDTYSDNAHNLFVQFLSTGGLLLIISFILLVSYIGYSLLKIIRNAHLEESAKIFYSSIFVAFLINCLVGIDNLGVMQWFWLLLGLIIAQSRLEFDSNDRKIRKKLPNEELTKTNTIVKKALLLPIFLVLSISNPIVLKTLITEVTIRNLYVESAKQNHSQEIAQKIASKARGVQDPNIRMNAIKFLYDTRHDDIAFTLAKDTNSLYPRSLIILESMALYHEKYGNYPEAIKIRERQIKLDPLFQGFKEKLAILKSSTSTK